MPLENFVYLTVYIRCLGGKKVGKTKMSQITYGLQLGGGLQPDDFLPRRAGAR